MGLRFDLTTSYMAQFSVSHFHAQNGTMPNATILNVFWVHPPGPTISLKCDGVPIFSRNFLRLVYSKAQGVQRSPSPRHTSPMRAVNLARLAPAEGARHEGIKETILVEELAELGRWPRPGRGEGKDSLGTCCRTLRHRRPATTEAQNAVWQRARSRIN